MNETLTTSPIRFSCFTTSVNAMILKRTLKYVIYIMLFKSHIKKPLSVKEKVSLKNLMIWLK